MSRVLRDGIIGISDGLTIPFILAAGLCGADARQETLLIVAAAGILGGAISMGLGGFFAFKAEVGHLSGLDNPVPLMEEERNALINLGLDQETQALMEAERLKDQEMWKSFQSQFELAELQAGSRQSLQRAFLIFGTYMLGGLIPILPFLFNDDRKTALLGSCVATGIALLCFGIYKTKIAGREAIPAVLQQTAMAFAGAAAAWFIARLFIAG